jgi:uncharacterized short protein YbdD (DUF466 family)
MIAARTAPAVKPGPFAAAARVIKQIIGVPDYERYVAHLRAAHPECEPLPRDAFMRERLEARYNRPGSKCC